MRSFAGSSGLAAIFSKVNIEDEKLQAAVEWSTSLDLFTDGKMLARANISQVSRTWCRKCVRS